MAWRTGSWSVADYCFFITKKFIFHILLAVHWLQFLQAGKTAIPEVQTLVRSATDWTEDPVLLENVRRAVAATIVSEAR